MSEARVKDKAVIAFAIGAVIATMLSGKAKAEISPEWQTYIDDANKPEVRNYRLLYYVRHGVRFLNKSTGKTLDCSFGGFNDARTSGFYAGFEEGCREALTEEFGPVNK